MQPPVLRVSTIVPVHQGGADFAACYQALLAMDPAPDELIIVADGETDGAWRIALEATGTTLQPAVLCLHPAAGPAYARNRGAELATGDLLLFVDADVVVQPDLVARVREAFRGRTALSGVIGSYDDEPAHGGFLSQFRNLLHHYTHQQSDPVIHTFWSGCGAVRRTAFEAVGGFSEAFARPSVEDIDLGYRLTRRGGRIRLDASIEAKHLKAWTAPAMVRTDVLARAAPWTELLLRYRVFDNNLNVDHRSRISTVAVVLALAAAAALPFAPVGAAPVLAAALVALLLANALFYRFLYRKRGAGFALLAIPWHVVFYACGALGFLIGLGRHVLGRTSPPTSAARAPSRRIEVRRPQPAPAKVSLP